MPFRVSFFLLISLLMGGITNDNTDESIFLVEAAVMVPVQLIKMLYIIWRKNEILELLHLICVLSIEHTERFTLVNRTLNFLMKCFSFM